MSEDLMIAAVNAFIQLGGKPVLPKGTWFSYYVNRHLVGKCIGRYLSTYEGYGYFYARRDSCLYSARFSQGDYDRGTVVVEKLPLDACPLAKWGTM
jgi:hypothetical protein